jgi:RNA polymerase sigma factor (sigma-70 family)
MARPALGSVVQQIGELFEVGSATGLSDRQLLERYNARGRDSAGEAALAALVARHGPMVLGISRQILGDVQHAEDVFQAVFIVLAQKARWIRDPDLLGNWLYGVATRLARRARQQVARRRRAEGDTMSVSEMGMCATAEPTADRPAIDREQAEALHGEIARLPRSFRLPVVLFYLEGLTLDEAARRLRCSAGTVHSRLARARVKLRRALTRRGMVLSSAALATDLSSRHASACLSSSLCLTATRAAIHFAAGPAAGAGLSASAAALAREMLRSMLLDRLKLAALCLLALLAAGAGYLIHPVAATVLAGQGPRTAPGATRPLGEEVKATPKTADGGGDREELVLTYLAGFVRDADGKPLSGAAVSLTGTQGYVSRGGRSSEGSGHGTSGADGHYQLSVRTKPGTSVEVWWVSAQARGFVRADVSFHAARPVMRPGATTEVNLGLVRGEVLAGVVSLPLRLSDRLEGIKPGEQTYFIQVDGPGFKQTFETEPSGAFEVWVPKGVYRLVVLGSGEGARARLEKVASGTRGLKLEPIGPPIAKDVLAQGFDALWEDMARNYSYFELKKVDWTGLKAKYRARAIGAATLLEFADVLGEMLGELDDGHVRFLEPWYAVVAYRPQPQRVSANFEAVEEALKGAASVGNGFARIGTTKADGFGVVQIARQSRADEAAVRQVAEFIRAHDTVPGFLVDLRGADGDDELLARVIAREFCAAPTVYARSKYRDGPRPTDFGTVHDRILEPSDRPFTKPVVCLLGPSCVSSGEGLAQMLVCLPNFTSIGLPTRGSSGNPRPFKLPGVPVTIVYSRWVDLMRDGQPIEGRGIQPKIRVDVPDIAFQDRDPIWERAVELLRERVRARP